MKTIEIGKPINLLTKEALDLMKLEYEFEEAQDYILQMEAKGKCAICGGEGKVAGLEPDDADRDCICQYEKKEGDEYNGYDELAQNQQ